MLDALLREIAAEADETNKKMEKTYALEITGYELDLLKDTLKERSNEDLDDDAMSLLCGLWNKVMNLKRRIHD